MTWGRMKVRNACPFAVTFYALAGPTLELAPGETKTAHACLIWFSTRVKGPGNATNIGHWEQYRDDYIAELSNEGFKASDWKSGGTGVAAGSILGWIVSELDSIFKVKNTNPDENFYFGDKKEGVYGSSDLVVYATLDKIYKIDPIRKNKIWYLHLEHDSGQVTPPEDSEPLYTVPDLSAYAHTMFIRACNQYGYLSASRDKESVEIIKHSEPYNPIEYPSYWAISPENAGDGMNRVKILNVFSNKWLTDFSSQGNKVGLYPVGYADYEDQHWNITEIRKNPEVVTLNNSYTRLNLFANDKAGVGVYDPDYPDQHFTIQTFTTDANQVPEGVTFRIMHAESGQYITISDSGDAYIDYTDNNNQLFYIKNLDGDIKICTVRYDSYLTFYWNNKLGTCSMGTAYDHNPDQAWEFATDSKFSGIYIQNKNGANKGRSNLYYNETNKFGLYFGNFPDQLWVFQLETTDLT